MVEPVKNRRVLQGYVSEEEYAQELGVSVRTMRSWRARGVAPPYVRIGQRIYYSVTKARAA